MSDPGIDPLEADWRPADPPAEAAAPSSSAVDNQTLLVGVIGDVRDLIASVLARLDHLDAAVTAKDTDPRVVELGAAVSSIVTMLENIETSVEQTARLVPPPPVFDDATGLTARVHAAAGAVGTDALLHARIEAIEQHVINTAADVRRLAAELEHLDESIGYLAAALLGGSPE
jgi:hypothetical protein